MILLLLICLLVVISWLWLRQHFNYWKRQGIPQKSQIYIVGDSWKNVLRLQSMAETVEDLYKAFPEARYSGTYQFLKEGLVIRDPNLIKQITVKDFEHFINHRGFISETAEPLIGKNLFVLKDQQWKDMRSTLSPAFTSSKMKFMFSLMRKSGQQFINYYLEQNKNVITLDIKDSFTRFTNDVIANVAFGIECNSLKEPNNQFFLMGCDATNFNKFKTVLKLFTFFFSEKLFSLLKLRLFSEKVVSFFSKVIEENITSREKHGIVRPDMIHLMLQSRKNSLNHEQVVDLPDTGFAAIEESDIGKSGRVKNLHLTNDDITAQAFIFFVAGFETASTAMCFLSHELAVNPTIQARLRTEIYETWDKCQSNLTYEALTTMKYLDMVVSESLRKWPNAVATDRLCTKPLTIEPNLPNEKPLRLEEGALIMVPIFGIHRDSKYYPDPDRFDPERFSDENKHRIKPYTYMPFGAGPRACIGSRFALLELKTLIFYLLLNFEIVPVEKTQIPLKLSKIGFQMSAEKGFWLGLQRRHTL